LTSNFAGGEQLFKLCERQIHRG